MPTKRTRTTRNIVCDISEAAWAAMLDAELPDAMNCFEVLDLAYPTVSTAHCKALWVAHRDAVLSVFIAENPCSRPSWFYLFDPDRPAVEEADVIRYRWQGCFWLSYTPALRRRFGGTGTPKFEVMNQVPSFFKGVPDHGFPSRT
jgi:hypothetical protein